MCGTEALERVQKAAVKVILGRIYNNYNDGLRKLRIENLDERRKQLCLRFAKNCLKNDKVKGMFPKRKTIHKMKKRKEMKYSVRFARTKRYKKSTIPYMVGLLNSENEKQQAQLK